MEALAVIIAIQLGILTVFQFALALGAPWGAAAYAGLAPGVLPKGLRINSAVFGVIVFPIVILYVLDAGEVLDCDWLPGSRLFVMWLLVAFFAIGTLMNAISRSKIERVWVPVSLVAGLCSLVLALGL